MKISSCPKKFNYFLRELGSYFTPFKKPLESDVTKGGNMSQKVSEKPKKLVLVMSINLKISFIYSEMKEIIFAVSRWFKKSIMTLLSVIIKIKKLLPPMF